MASTAAACVNEVVYLMRLGAAVNVQVVTFMNTHGSLCRVFIPSFVTAVLAESRYSSTSRLLALISRIVVADGDCKLGCLHSLNILLRGEISGSVGDEYEDGRLVGCCVVCFVDIVTCVRFSWRRDVSTVT
jgi:hypothetical protein